MIEKTYPISQKLLENGLDLSLNLLDVLTKEADELKEKTDSVKLSDIITEKKELVSRLDQFSKQFAQILATEQLQMTAADVTDYFALADKANLNTSESLSLWKQIVETSRQSQMLNQRNGASINILAQYTQRSLQILKGKSQQATVYRPDGSTYNEQGISNTLTSA